METKYLIIDPRPSECFRKKTFSEYKKTDVLKELFKNITENKIDNACFWLTESIVSGYIDELFEIRTTV